MTADLTAPCPERCQHGNSLALSCAPQSGMRGAGFAVISEPWLRMLPKQQVCPGGYYCLHLPVEIIHNTDQCKVL